MPGASDPTRLRLLVGIASYGRKNLAFLKRIIATYQSLPYDVDVVVFSDAPKELDSGIKVEVGLPSKNSWSLPFAHKRYFADRLEQYDLFVYSEDDMEIDQSKIEAFLRVTGVLDPTDVAGYLRYELDESEAPILTDVHGAFHWAPESVRRRGDYIFAEFTNEHAGFYILTREQLQHAIASGGYLKAPYEGRLGLPETAATDPYTNCGLKKVICVSMLDDFLLHHMSNLYIARHGVSLKDFRGQVQTLLKIEQGSHPVTTLCGVESRFLHCAWSKSYYERSSVEVLESVPFESRNVISIGCGFGDTEAELQKRGANVAVLPIDSVVGDAAEARGCEVIYGTLMEGLELLRGRQFDCVLMTNLLHLLPSPWPVLQEIAGLVSNGGTFVVVGPNFQSLPILVRRTLGFADYKKLGSFSESGIHSFGMGTLLGQIKRTNLKVTSVRWFEYSSQGRFAWLKRRLSKLMAKSWLIQARKCG